MLHALISLTAEAAAAAENTASEMASMNIDSLITDLAFILILGAVVTVIFKWIKQPVVLGYIVAGFLASPNFEPLPSVANEANIEFWAQLGIVVLLFSLGLEFSFKKLVNTGGSAVVTALIIVIGMMATGFAIGMLMHFTPINSLFLGGMLSMSSTTIIIKALTDLGMKQRKFASLVFAVLVVEDIFAVVMMVLLSSIAVGNVEGGEMLMSVSKLVFFLVIWFLVGIFLLPTLLNKSRRFLNNETLLVVSMGLCLGMAIFSVACGFSLALGAFVMGSILAGTSYAERIEKVTMPVKDLFGAVFFISVGMMVQPAVIAEYWGPILILSGVVIVGMILFGVSGMLVTGQSLKVAIESGFSLTQIGEFAFIIATLGMSLGVLDPTIYPIVVAVSVITTFTTPYFIKMSDPVYRFTEKHLPERLHFLIDRYNREASEASNKSEVWKGFLQRYVWRTLIYIIVLIAIMIVSHRFFVPWLEGLISNQLYAHIVAAAVTLAAMSPFLLALILPPSKSAEASLGQAADSSDGKTRRHTPYAVPKVVIAVFKSLIAIWFIVHVLASLFSLKVGFLVGLGIILFVGLLLSKKLVKRLRGIEKVFINNLNERDLRRSGRNNNVVSDLHEAYMEVGSASAFAGQRLGESQIRAKYGVNISSITRGAQFIPAPKSNDRIFPGDIIGVIGNDEQIQRLLPAVEADEPEGARGFDPKDFHLSNISLSENSPLIGKTMITANVHAAYSALVVALERDGVFVDDFGKLVLQPGDTLYLFASKDTIKTLS